MADTDPLAGGLRRWRMAGFRFRLPGHHLVAVVLVSLTLGLLASCLPSKQGQRPSLDDVSSPPGTALPDGLEVADGSVLLGPVLVTGFTDGQRTSWQAVVAINGKASSVWQSYLEQFDRRIPGPSPHLDRPGVPGCIRSADDPIRVPTDATVCVAAFWGQDGTEVPGISAMLTSIPGDVTGRHLIVISASNSINASNSIPFLGFAERDPYVAADDFPEPAEPRQVEPGDPLAPNAGLPAATQGESRYTLLEGTSLVALFEKGFGTGGFHVLLKVKEDSDLVTMREAYVEQALDPDVREIFRNETTVGSTTFSEINVPGDAGGPDAIIRTVDDPGRESDYIFYRVIAD